MHIALKVASLVCDSATCIEIKKSYYSPKVRVAIAFLYTKRTRNHDQSISTSVKSSEKVKLISDFIVNIELLLL